MSRRFSAEASAKLKRLAREYRRRVVRLTPAQKAALTTALDRRPPAAVVRTIENELHQYREKQAQIPEGIRVTKRLHRRTQRAQVIARELCALLPFPWPFLISLPSGEQLTFEEVMALDVALRDRLTLGIARWTQVEARLRAVLPGKHRPPDDELPWLAIHVVEALDAAGVPLTLGHKTPVVEVVGLVRRWASGRPRQARRWSNADYQFTRAIVETYYDNLARRAVAENQPVRAAANPRRKPSTRGSHK